LYLQYQGVDLADNMRDPPIEREELTNLFDNIKQANLVAINEQTEIQIKANILNEVIGQSGNAIVKLRVIEDFWNED
ncbi:12483_t:CDS:2, partial [Cetraspora pellucida]